MESKVPFTISGKVVGGNKLGRTIDIPTANIFPKEDVSKMAFGVYYSKVFIGGKSYKAITNLGIKPTIADNSKVNAESFIYDFDGDIYDNEITVELLEFKRPERKFSSFEELGIQMKKDLEEGRVYSGLNTVEDTGLKNMEIETFSAKETFEIGRKIGMEALPGSVFTLIGDLGVGKTVLTQGVAEGLGIEEPVNSPTFTILQVYDEGRLPFYHFDVYRIADESEMDEIGYEEYFYGDGVCFVEWANLIPGIVPKKHTEIKIEKNPEKGFDYRKITIKTFE